VRELESTARGEVVGPRHGGVVGGGVADGGNSIGAIGAQNSKRDAAAVLGDHISWRRKANTYIIVNDRYQGIGGAKDRSPADDIGKDDRKILVPFNLSRIENADGEGLADLIIVKGKGAVSADVFEPRRRSPWDGGKIDRDNP